SAQYGFVSADVRRVASEVRDGTVRVELAVVPDPESRIPLQHALPGSIEVLVENVSPARLLFRSAGRLLGGPAAEAPRCPGGAVAASCPPKSCRPGRWTAGPPRSRAFCAASAFLRATAASAKRARPRWTARPSTRWRRSRRPRAWTPIR